MHICLYAGMQRHDYEKISYKIKNKEMDTTVTIKYNSGLSKKIQNIIKYSVSATTNE